MQHPLELNRYGYGANNPVNATDPSGELLVPTTLTLDKSSSVALSALPKITAFIFVTTALVTFVFFSKNKAERKDINRAVRNYNRNNNCNIDPNHFREWMHREYKKGRQKGDLRPEEILDALGEYTELFCGGGDE